jgi:WhiB family redox-sensing transcriptional regulator
MRKSQPTISVKFAGGGRKNLEWQLAGACRAAGVDPEIFYLPHNARLDEKKDLVKQAKAVCATCPVILQCREYSLDIEEQFGVWGGLSEDERRNLLRRRRRHSRVEQ